MPEEREILVELAREHHQMYHRYDGGKGFEACEIEWCQRARRALGMER